MSNIINDLSSIDPRKLLWFSNGVYDLEIMQFRSDTREYVHANQYINCGYNYGETRDCNKEAEIMHYWQQVLPEQSIREYYLTCLGSCLEGYNREQMVLAIIGCVSSKSTSCQLIQATLGEYCHNIPFELDCCVSPDEIRSLQILFQPSPILDAIKNVRVVFAECSTRELSWKKMALLTSDQGICFRPPYQTYMDIVHPQCTPIVLLNTEPEYYKKEMPDKIDEVMWGKTINKLPSISWPIQELIKSIYEINRGRVKKFRFKTRFVANPRNDSKGDEIRERHKIVNYSDRFQDWRLSFFHILLDYYRRYKRNGLPSLPL